MGISVRGIVVDGMIVEVPVLVNYIYSAVYQYRCFRLISLIYSKYLLRTW